VAVQSSCAVAKTFGISCLPPNYSFKPNPLRGSACVPALRLHAFAATARVGLTQVLAHRRKSEEAKFSAGVARTAIQDR
jgi:hypothetical protein